MPWCAGPWPVSKMLLLLFLLITGTTRALASRHIVVQPGTDELHRVLRREVRRRRRSGAFSDEPLELWLATGVHRLTRTLEITPAHGRLHFVGSRGSETWISGGVNVSGWTPGEHDRFSRAGLRSSYSFGR